MGKTEYALSYAEEHDAEIISCDASLFYRGMDIGTAKPTKAERARVPHYMIDICDVAQPYDIVNYVEEARRVVDAVMERGKAVVVTGGSGLYLKSFFAPVLDTIQIPDRVRQEVADIYERAGLAGLMEELCGLNPDGIENLDTQNPRRVLRALERCVASGKGLKQLQEEFAAQPEPYAEFTKRLILLEREKEDLKNRITLRARTMLEEGLVKEVRDLRQNGIEENPSAASAIGYRETLSFLKGELDETGLLEVIIQNTSRLAKKQRTWFRTQLPEPELRLEL